MQNTSSYFDTLNGAPIDLADLLAFHRARFAGWRMEDDADDKSDDDADDADGDDANPDGDADDKSDDDAEWKAKFEAQQRINRNLERRTKRDAARIKQLEDTKSGDGSDDKPDLDKIKADARAEATREVLHSRVEDKIEAKARAFADPEDAVAVLLRSHSHDDFLDGDKIDAEAIADALTELGEKKPHLLAQGGKKFQGDGDGGTRKGDPSRPKDLGEALARHYKKR